jgi:uncharacterized protein YciI
MTPLGKWLIGLVTVWFIAGGAGAADIPPKMKKYQMVFFRKGPNTNAPAGEAAKIQAAHLEELIQLNLTRTNLLFGPFRDDTDLRGIAVLDVPDAEAARQTLANDPYVKSGQLRLEVKPWLSETNVFGLPEKPHMPENLIFGFLMRGTNRTSLPAEESQKIQRGHLDYMTSLHQQGKLIAAGPFMDNTDMRGLVIYRVATIAEASELAAGDPAVKAGRLVIDARPWMTFKGILK